MTDEVIKTRLKQTIVLQKASPIFWRVLNRILTGSTFSALAYNGLVAVITEWFYEGKTIGTPKIESALSHSRMAKVPSIASTSLKQLCEVERLNFQLTDTQRLTLAMVLQKLDLSDLD